MDDNYEGFFNTNPDFLFVLDEKGRIIHFNQTVLSRLGYSKVELLGSDILMVHPLERREEAGRIVGEMLVGTSEFCPVPLITKSGQQIAVETRVKAGIWDGKPAIFGVTKDISSIKFSEEKFSKVFYLNPSACGLSDLNTEQYVEVNDVFYKLLGFEESEVIGHTASELGILTAETKAKVLTQASKDGRISNVETDLTAKDGSIKHVILSAENLYVQDRQLRYTVVQDITARKLAEKALATEKERLSVTLRSISEGVVTTDINGKIVIMNKTAEVLSGWTQAEAFSRSLEEVLNITEIRADDTENIPSLQLKAKDGSVYLVSLSKATIFDEVNNEIGEVLVFQNITDKKNLEAVLQRNTILESLGLLAGGIAHDFNNLLGGIFGLIELAQYKSTEIEVSKYLLKSLTTIERAKALTQQLLTFAKGGEPICKLEDIRKIIEEATEFTLSGANVSSIFNFDKNLWLCNVDKNQFSQVIGNLVINAVQAMPNGGNIEVKANNVTIFEAEKSPLTKGSYVHVAIIDHGVGIPKDKLSKIFNPFFTTKAKGQGLGLSTCYSIMTRHHGCIEVDSVIGVGTTFHLYIPAVGEDGNPSSGQSTDILSSQDKVILILEDEEVLRESLSEILGVLGYKCICASKGEEAIDIFMKDFTTNKSIKGLIFDLTIPGALGGKDTIMYIRKVDKNIPAFLISGYGEDPVLASPKVYGYTACLQKPFRIKELETLLKNNIY